MVERPIKKSELQKRAKTEGQTNGDKGSDQKARKGGRGKGRDNKEKKKPATPLALMRGPRPTAKVEAPEPVEVPEETTIDGEGTAAVAAETTAEDGATETVAEVTETGESEVTATTVPEVSETAKAETPSESVDADANNTDEAGAAAET